MHADGDTLMIEIGAAPTIRAAGRHRLACDGQAGSDGEYHPRREPRETLTYHHPVREISPVGMWNGEAMTLRLPLKDLKLMGGDCLVALLQVESVGAILGAAEFHQL